MRFIVDIYRWVVLGMLALVIVAVVYAGLKISTASALFGTMFLIYGSIAVLLIVLSLGATAIIVSIHDRHAELVDELREIRLALQARG